MSVSISASACLYSAKSQSVIPNSSWDTSSLLCIRLRKAASSWLVVICCRLATAESMLGQSSRLLTIFSDSCARSA
eukprot:CAMPEP_0198223142 /NCGR_PEP_ID=MMETSP1445-20131203/91193_1 /TAXON_ID=36898 /ORGANISM="Pyramimonas sp., Strain CCMP2087" /LENGTH=75 /DNA_ID=CAMNT_0043901889 /DNA_START=45 /DNA_END=269 /DNA_ORIENTATION=+